MVEEPSEGVILPVCHIYYPDTFHSVLESFFSRRDDTFDASSTPTVEKCLILGRWELRSGRPGKFVKEEPPQQPGKRRRKRGGRAGTSSSFLPTPSSQEQQDSPLEAELNFRRVLAVNIVGVVEESHVPDSGYSDLQIVGEVQQDNSSVEVVQYISKDFVGPYFHFQCKAGSSASSQNDISVTGLIWNGRLHNIGGYSRLLVFIYDPVEFQQWKVPRGYPLGVPPVFLDGLTFIQHQLQLEQELTFTPAFTPLLQDHQNLNACSESPTSSYLYTNPVLHFISHRSSGLQQISHKVSLLTGTFLGHYQILPVLNFLIILGLDALLGYFITSYLIQIPNMLGLLHTTVDDMLDRLNHLLRWLHGAPAGLKLNVNLNSLYWRFFSYHIHLWANYIGILEPIFAIILHTIQYYGVLGSTIQISLLKDLLSLATFHVYCLYIYATRLYNLQTSTIKALCRMFFGRKYNPLRERIDNVQLTTPELFLSSFGFVILIFLLPTTMVYYAGFVCLRLPVLLLERILKYFVYVINKLPIVSWILVYLRSPRVADEVYLAPIVPSSSPTSFIHSATSNGVAFRLSLRSTRTLFTPPDLGKGIKTIVSAVMEGIVLKD